jgi:hypothetical protein
MSVFATSSFSSFNNAAHNHSLSTEWERSSLRLPTTPSGSLRMSAVGVEPNGLYQKYRLINSKYKRGIIIRISVADCHQQARRSIDRAQPKVELARGRITVWRSLRIVRAVAGPEAVKGPNSTAVKERS